MRHGRWIGYSIAAFAAAAGLAARAGAQTLSPTITNISGVTLTSFTPYDSAFINPTATSFLIKLRHTLTGTASEYRVSRFSDFRDANWLPYASLPALNVPISWFPATSNGERVIHLYFQLRVKNPKAGMPMSVVNGVAKLQPDYFFSDPKDQRIRIVYAG